MGKLLTFFRPPADPPRLSDPGDINRTYRRRRLSVMATITLGYSFMYTTRLPLSVVKKHLIDANIFSPTDLGVIGSALFFGYAFGKGINGFLADHAHLRRFFATGILLSALINLGMGSTTWFLFWVILWAFNGWFQGFGAPVSSVMLSNWFSRNERGTYYGIWSTAHSIGEGMTFVGTAALVSAFGWRFGFWGPGVVGVGVGIVALFTMFDRPPKSGLPPVAEWHNDLEEANDEAAASKSIGRHQLDVLRSPAIWILGLSSASMYVTRYAINSWGILYLQEARGYSLADAGWLLGFNTFAGIAGCIAYGFLSDRFFRGRRPPAILLFGLLEILALCGIFFAPTDQPLLLIAAFIAYGFTLSGILAALGGLFGIDLMAKEAAGAVMGFIGAFSYVAAASQEWISGYLIERGMTKLADGTRVYDFSTPILFWVGASVVSMLLALTLWSVRTKD